jgi:hypothetical protein
MLARTNSKKPLLKKATVPRPENMQRFCLKKARPQSRPYSSACDALCNALNVDITDEEVDQAVDKVNRRVDSLLNAGKDPGMRHVTGCGTDGS